MDGSMISHMIMMLVYVGAMYLAVWLLYTERRMAEAIRAAVPMKKRNVRAHLRPLDAWSRHTVGSGRRINTTSTTRLRGRG